MPSTSTEPPPPAAARFGPPDGARPSRAVGALAVVLAALLPAAAHAGPPFATDDPEPVPLHHWELYLAGTLRDDGGDLSGTAPHLEANYGALPNLQLHLLFPVAFDRPAPGEGVRYGPGDLEAGFKWRFVEEGKWRPQVGIFPIFTFPTGSAGRGLGEGAVHAFLPLWIQKSFGPWTTYGGGGWKRSGAAGTHGAYFVGWLLQRQIVEGWVLGAEVFHDAAERSDERSETRWNLGTIIDLNEHVHLLGSGGLAFGAHATPEMYLALLVTL